MQNKIDDLLAEACLRKGYGYVLGLTTGAPEGKRARLCKTVGLPLKDANHS